MPIKTSRFDVDIISQTLAEVIQRPRLGIQNTILLSGYLAANTENLIVNIVGAGMLWNTYFWADSTGLMDNDYLKLVADDDINLLPSFINFRDKNFTMGQFPFATGTLYDAVNFKVAGGSCTNWTFNNYYKLYYVETHGRNPLATLKFGYSLF